MIQTTDRYKQEINKNGIRGLLETQVSINVEDILFKDISVTSSNGELFYSNSVDLKTDKVIKNQFKTLEHNLLVLDDLGEYPKETVQYMGYISNQVSGVDKLYTSRPKLTVISDGNIYDILGLTLDFDILNKDYPEEFIVRYYFNTTLVETYNIKNNTQYQDVEIPGANKVNKIEIEFVKSSIKERRVRVSNLVFGTSIIYRADSIISFEQSIEVFPLAIEMNNAIMSVTIDNQDMQYDPENIAGKYKYLQYLQEAKVTHTMNYENGDTENIEGGTWYLNGKPSVESNTITLNFTQRYQKMTEIYSYGVYSTEPVSFYSLFEKLLVFSLGPNLAKSSEIKWVIDSSLQNVYTSYPLEVLAVNELLQLLCNATNSIIIEDLNGIVYVTRNNTIQSNYELATETMYDYPVYEQPLPDLKSVSINSTNLIIEQDKTEVLKREDNFYGRRIITETYQMSTNHTVSITNGVIHSIKYYAYMCEIDLETDGDFTLIINANQITEETTTHNYIVSDYGEVAEYENKYLTNINSIDRFANYVIQYLQEQYRYNISYRGDISLRPQDIIILDTKYKNNILSMILSSNIKQSNGAWSGELRLKNILSKPQYYINDIIADDEVII